MKKRYMRIHIITKELFQFSLVTYLMLLVTEIVKPGFVAYFFNLNILLGLVLLSGMFMVATMTEKKQADASHKKKLGKWDIQYIILLSIGGGLLVYYKTYALGNISVITAFVTMFVLAFLSFLFFSEEQQLPQSAIAVLPHENTTIQLLPSTSFESIFIEYTLLVETIEKKKLEMEKFMHPEKRINLQAELQELENKKYIIQQSW